jgi:hypothetical protein
MKEEDINEDQRTDQRRRAARSPEEPPSRRCHHHTEGQGLRIAERHTGDEEQSSFDDRRSTH